MIKKDIVGRSFAAYGKHRKTQVRILAGLLFTLAILAYAYFFRLVPNPYTGEGAEPYRTIIQYVAFGHVLAIGRLLYNVYLDMPYLHFTEERFYFDEDGSEVGGYWRDVTEISESEISTRGMPMPEKAVAISYNDSAQFFIDPRIVNLRGADASAVAKQFWQTSLARQD